MRRKSLAKAFVLLTMLFLLSTPNARAVPCEADITCDGKVNSGDLLALKLNYNANGCDECKCDPIYECPLGLIDCAGNCVDTTTDEQNCGDCGISCLYGQACLNSECVMVSFNPAPVPKTGQTTSYATGDDGDLEKGVAWPVPRFTDNVNGTVTDNLTGLIWLKNANCFGTKVWATALTDCNGLANGQCGLTDSSIAGDWRLPNRVELESLLDLKNYNPALPTGHPFTGVQFTFYWSGTSYAINTDYAWIVSLINGYVSNYTKTSTYYVWPVRGGN